MSQSFAGNKRSEFECMHPSTPLPKQQQAVSLCVCMLPSTRVGAGTDWVHTPWPCAMDHEGLLKAWFVIENEILSILIHISRFDFIPCAFKL